MSEVDPAPVLQDDPIVEPDAPELAPDPAAEPEIREPSEPSAPDPRDAVIERLTQALVEQSRAPARAEPAPAAPKTNALEDKMRKLGFGNVAATDTSPGVNMIPALLELFTDHGEDILGRVDRAVAPRLNAMGNELVETKFGRELAVRVQKQTPEFVAFREAEMARDPQIGAFIRGGAEKAAAELVASRWHAQRRLAKQGEDRRLGRLAGGELQAQAPRGGSGAGPTIRLSAAEPTSTITRKLCEFADRGGDPKNIVWLKRGEK